MSKSHRPWWKKKRWAAALTLWLLLPFAGYPLSTGPVLYGYARRWVPVRVARAYCHAPVNGLRKPGWHRPLARY